MVLVLGVLLCLSLANPFRVSKKEERRERSVRTIVSDFAAEVSLFGEKEDENGRKEALRLLREELTALAQNRDTNKLLFEEARKTLVRLEACDGRKQILNEW